MLKLRREFSRAITILEMVKKREKSKRELLHLTLEVVEKRYAQTKNLTKKTPHLCLISLRKETKEPKPNLNPEEFRLLLLTKSVLCF